MERLLLPQCRMRAETLLRLGEYELAFDAFRKCYARSLHNVGECEVAPFRLLHDAECIEHAVTLGADPSNLSTSRAWRELAQSLIEQVLRT